MTLRDTIAHALYDDGAYCGECDYAGWGSCNACRAVVEGYADTAITIMRAQVEAAQAVQGTP